MLTYFFKELTGSPMAYFAALAALGTLSMSIVQAIKNLTPVHFYFQSLRFRWWMKNNVEQAKANLAVKADVADVLAETVTIAAAGNSKAFYGAESDEFFKQVAVVGRLALNYPTVAGHKISYKVLLAVFASNMTPSDLHILLDSKTATAQEKLDARNRVQALLFQGIDAFRITTDWWWQNGLHIAAFVCSFVLAAVGTYKGSEDHKVGVGTLLSAILAAFLAPVARDLVAAIKQLRTP